MTIQEVEKKYGVGRLVEYYTDFDMWDSLEDFIIGVNDIEEWADEYRKDEVLKDHFPVIDKIEYEGLYNMGKYVWHYFANDKYDRELDKRMRKVQENYFKKVCQNR